MNEEQTEEIIKKLDLIIKILASKEIRDINQTESIIFLDSLGFDREIISILTGVKKTTISVRLSEAKKKSKDQ